MPVTRGQGPRSHPWARWALRWGAPNATVALVAVWALEPDSLVGGVIAAGVALAALLVFAGTMPRRQPSAERARRGE
ncbi:hypothetical protein [Streptomyces lavendulae]|uniref:hypothetical protein n=1 Tax=Streptomyces lavendulae TaxID=1914 RepID=UPI0024A35433|nr:hypothetical protein [Streptomyces lavendulae]GLX22596.1 hypothetical protein Slala01_62400 [Streptomyces lavendulae subsp. lavendulae]GLX30079.1 hypothetical protein Slala02_58990 [Streptomyces lavendulae subsp. lavendulae]